MRVLGVATGSAVVLFWLRGGLVNTLVPAYAFDRLHLSQDSIGVGLAIAVLATVAVTSHAGYVADRGRLERPVIVAAAALLTAVVAAMAFAPGQWALFGLLALFGVATGYLLTIPQVMLVAWTAPQFRGRAVGSYRTATSLGLVIGPLTASTLAHAAGLRVAVLTGAVSALGLTVAAAALPSEPAPVFD
jgi:MFS family permease